MKSQLQEKIELCGRETNHVQVNNTGFCRCTHVMFDLKKGDDCDVCGLEMPLNTFSGLFGVHPECLSAEEKHSLETAIAVF